MSAQSHARRRTFGSVPYFASFASHKALVHACTHSDGRRSTHTHTPLAQPGDYLYLLLNAVTYRATDSLASSVRRPNVILGPRATGELLICGHFTNFHNAAAAAPPKFFLLFPRVVLPVPIVKAYVC